VERAPEELNLALDALEAEVDEVKVGSDRWN